MNTKTNAFHQKHKNHYFAILIPLIITISYSPFVFHLGYVWDDISMFIMNPALRVKSMAWHAIWQPIFPGATYFRPLVMGTLALQFITVGLSAGFAHGVNLLLLCTNSILVYFLALFFLDDFDKKSINYRASAAALIYGLHPAIIESTSWVVGRFDEMSTLFILGGLLAYTKGPSRKNIIYVNALFFMSALCKEEAIVFPILFFLMNTYKNNELNLRNKILNKSIPLLPWYYISLLISGCLYLALRIKFIQTIQSSNVSLLDNKLAHIAYVGETLWAYFRVSFWPFGYFGSVHPTTLFNFMATDYLIGFAVVAACIFLLLSSLLGKSKFLILFTMWLCALLPVSNIIPLTIGNNIIQDRFLTLPLVFLVIAIMRFKIPQRLINNKNIFNKLPLAIAAIWILMSILTIRTTVPLWTNNFTFWSWAIKENPNDYYIRYNYVGSCLQYNQLNLADNFFKKYPNETSPQITAVHGDLLIKEGKIKEGLNTLLDAEKNTPRPYIKLINMNINIANAHALSGTGDLWFNQYLYTQIANAYLLLGDYKNAYHYAIIATFYSYYFPAAWLARSLAAYGSDNLEDANLAFDHVMEYSINNAKPNAINERNKFIQTICKESAQSKSKVCISWENHKIPTPPTNPT